MSTCSDGSSVSITSSSTDRQNDDQISLQHLPRSNDRVTTSRPENLPNHHTEPPVVHRCDDASASTHTVNTGQTTHNLAVTHPGTSNNSLDTGQVSDNDLDNDSDLSDTDSEAEWSKEITSTQV